MTLKFLKMDGCGNDFAIFDGRKDKVKFSPTRLQSLAARRTGIGCDQIIVMEKSKQADCFMRIFNADGTEVSSCGNATRCLGWILMEESGKDSASIETSAGLLACERAGEMMVRVDMGAPRLDWQDIPLSETRDTLHMGLSFGEYDDPAAVSMGNPHVIFVVSNVDIVPLEEIGPQLEHYSLFPQRANISFAQVTAKNKIRLRVWERGSGITLACGTAACATLVALNRRGLVGRKAEVELPGGVLAIEWDEDTDHVWMTGAVQLAFSGVIDE